VSDTPGLSTSIAERELESHLNDAAQLGSLLGLSKREMQRRMAEAYEKSLGKKK
jgi:hypothetical protein